METLKIKEELSQEVDFLKEEVSVIVVKFVVMSPLLFSFVFKFFFFSPSKEVLLDGEGASFGGKFRSRFLLL